MRSTILPGLLHYIHDKTNINQYTFSSNTVTTMGDCGVIIGYCCFSIEINDNWTLSIFDLSLLAAVGIDG